MKYVIPICDFHMFNYKAFYKLQIVFNCLLDKEKCSIKNCNNDTDKMYEVESLPEEVFLKVCSEHIFKDAISNNEYDYCYVKDCDNLIKFSGYVKI